MKYFVFTVVMGLLLPYLAFTQPINDLPAEPIEGRCHARAVTSDQYIEIEEKREKPRRQLKSEYIPAVYDTIKKRVLIKESYTEVYTVPAVFDTLWIPFKYKDSSRVIEERYRTLISKHRLTSDGKEGEWVTIKIPGCESEKPEDCETLRWIPKKPEYKINTKNMFLKAKWSDKEKEEGKTDLIPKVVVVKPAQTKQRFHPAEYQTVKQAVLRKHARRQFFEAEPEYEIIKHKKITKKGGDEIWVEVICPEVVNKIMISQIQLALKGRRYYDGAISGIIDNATRLALETYQGDSGLPVGKLDKETLEALGFKFETFSQPFEKVSETNSN